METDVAVRIWDVFRFVSGRVQRRMGNAPYVTSALAEILHRLCGVTLDIMGHCKAAVLGALLQADIIKNGL